MVGVAVTELTLNELLLKEALETVIGLVNFVKVSTSTLDYFDGCARIWNPTTKDCCSTLPFAGC